MRKIVNFFLKGPLLEVKDLGYLEGRSGRPQNHKEIVIGWGVILSRTLAWLILLFVALFIPAGKMSYWQGWVFLASIVLQMAVGLVIFSQTPDLLRERIKPGPGTKWWDKVFMALFIPLFLAVLVTGSLDTGRFHWTRPLPWAVYFVSYLVFILSSAFLFWSMWVNRFFSSVVRIQSDRGQTVIQNGPYRFVRHPGYLGGIVWIFTNPLILGSLQALIPAGAAVILLLLRTCLEDRTLQKELPGYSEYARRVRYRLLPGVW